MTVLSMFITGLFVLRLTSRGIRVPGPADSSGPDVSTPLSAILLLLNFLYIGLEVHSEEGKVSVHLGNLLPIIEV